jgi:hypothetical protein
MEGHLERAHRNWRKQAKGHPYAWKPLSLQCPLLSISPALRKISEGQWLLQTYASSLGLVSVF